jgi:hypothetical protein
MVRLFSPTRASALSRSAAGPRRRFLPDPGVTVVGDDDRRLTLTMLVYLAFLFLYPRIDLTRAALVRLSLRKALRKDQATKTHQRPTAANGRGPSHVQSSSRRSGSGSLAMVAAMRRAMPSLSIPERLTFAAWSLLIASWRRLAMVRLIVLEVTTSCGGASSSTASTRSSLASDRAVSEREIERRLALRGLETKARGHGVLEYERDFDTPVLLGRLRWHEIPLPTLPGRSSKPRVVHLPRS